MAAGSSSPSQTRRCGRRSRGSRQRAHVRRRGGTNAWYATDLDFQRALEAELGAHAEHRGQVSCYLANPGAGRTGQRVLVYEHSGLDVPSRRGSIPVRVEFHEDPDYNTYGLLPADYPRVLADPGAPSKHRLPGDALCLWFPGDPEERRWQYTSGLVTLFNNVRNHLFFEEHWRATGGSGDDGHPEGIWLGDEAPHGFPSREAAA